MNLPPVQETKEKELLDNVLSEILRLQKAMQGDCDTYDDKSVHRGIEKASFGRIQRALPHLTFDSTEVDRISRSEIDEACDILGILVIIIDVWKKADSARQGKESLCAHAQKEIDEAEKEYKEWEKERTKMHGYGLGSWGGDEAVELATKHGLGIAMAIELLQIRLGISSS